MKRIIYYIVALALCLPFVGCSDDDEVSSQELSIASFYPTQVMKGTEVTVVGTAMNKVREVVFPGGVSSADITVIDDRTLNVIAPDGVSESPATLVVRAEGEEVASRQTIRLAKPAFRSYAFSTNEGAETGGELSITGTDLLLVDAVALSLDGKTVTVPALEMLRKSTDAIKFTVPEDAPIGDEVNVHLLFKNGTTMDLPAIKVAEGTGGGSWVEKEVVIYEGDPFDVGGWSALQIEASKLPEMKEGDVIRVYIQDVQSGAQGSLKCTADGWPGLSPEMEYFDLTQDDINAGYYMCTLTQDMLDKLAGNNLIISGQKYVIAKVSVFTSVWVGGSDGDQRDPITDKTFMINDFEKHGDHDASWDLSWTDAEATKVETDDSGNTYIHLVKALGNASGSWFVNCNHLDLGTVANIEDYVVKFDVKIDKGTVGASKAAMQFVLNGKWCWVGEGMFPETTNEKWMTMSFDMAQWKDNLSGEVHFAANTENGIYGGSAEAPIPAGISIDNLRLDPK